MSFCPVTGGKECFCETKPATKIGSALLVDAKAALRKLFSDHLFYTLLVINETVPHVEPSQPEFVKRLLQNPKDLGEFLTPIVGADKAKIVDQLFTEHLELAAATLGPLNAGDKKKIDAAVKAFFDQGERLAQGLSSLRPNKLSLVFAWDLVSQHNHFVVDLAVLRSEGKTKQQIKTFDRYFHHGLKFADVIYEALTS